MDFLPGLEKYSAKEVYEIAEKYYVSEEPLDWKLAYKYYCHSYLMKYPDATYKIYLLLREGKCVEKSNSESFFYLEEAAVLGHPTAQEDLARFLLRRNTEKDDIMARYWMKKAMDSNSEFGLLMYAFLCFDDRNYLEAVKYFPIVETYGYTNANLFMHKIFILSNELKDNIKSEYYFNKASSLDLSHINNFVDFKHRIDWLEEIAVIKPNIYVILGDYYDMNEDYVNAARCYNRVLDFDSKNIMVKLCRALYNSFLPIELQKDIAYSLVKLEKPNHVLTNYLGDIFYLAALFFYNRKRYAQALTKAMFSTDNYNNMDALRLVNVLLDKTVVPLETNQKMELARYYKNKYKREIRKCSSTT